MNKKIIGSAIAVSLGSSVSFNVSAVLASNAVLQFTDGCIEATPIGTFYCGASGRTGSYFAMDLNANGILSVSESTAMTRLQGIQINATQLASGSHSGFPDGTESASIDTAFQFFGSTGMHETRSPVTILSDNGVGQVTLDFSGWSIIWDGDSNVMDLGGHNTTWPGTGIATLTCGTDCSFGDTFTLDYQSRVTSTPFNGVLYGLHLEGVISSVPVPAGVWLFSSGLIGLAGVLQRRKII